MEVWVVHRGWTVYGVFNSRYDAMLCRAKVENQDKKTGYTNDSVCLTPATMDKFPNLGTGK
jgi:hypothetical protein